MQQEDRINLNGMKVFPFCSSTELLTYVDSHKGILVAVNAEKVTKATKETRAIVNNNIGSIVLVSSAIYGEVRAVGAQYGMSFAGELCVCDITLQNFDAVGYYGDKTTAVLNIDKIGGAQIRGTPCIQATSAQMKDAAWLNEHGFPCK